MAGISSPIKDSFLDYAKRELEASLSFLSAAHWFQEKHLTGIADKFKEQSDTQMGFFRSILEYITLRGEPLAIGNPALGAQEWTDELATFELFYKLHISLYQALLDLFRKAREAEDIDAERFLKTLIEKYVVSIDEWEGWFIQAQSYTALPGLIWHLNKIIG